MKTTIIGWGLYSTPSTDTECLEEYFKNKHQLDMAICWRKVYFWPAGQKTPILGDTPVDAIHFEVAQEDATKVTRLLYKIYSTKKKTFPLHFHMRFVPHVSQTEWAHTLASIEHLRNHQITFIASIQSQKIFNVANPGRKHPSLGDQSLLAMIMNIPHMKHSGCLMFLLAKPVWNSDSQVKVHFFSSASGTAEIATYLLAFLKSVHQPPR